MSPLATAALALAAAGGAPQQTVWHDAYASAQKRAADDGKDLLIVFTGSDWCAPCIELEQRVFSQESFTIVAERAFVLTRLDYPRSAAAKERVPDAAANQALAERHRVTQFPTVILTHADGEAYARTGSVPGGPSEYLAHLDDLHARASAARVAVLELLARAERTAADATLHRATILAAVAAFRALAEELLVRERLLPLIRRGLADDDGELAADCLRLLLEARSATLAEEERALRDDADNARGLYEEVVLARLDRTAFVEEMADWCALAERYVALERHHDPDRATRILIAASKFYHGYLSRPQGARRMAERARDLGRLPDADVDFIRRMTGQ